MAQTTRKSLLTKFNTLLILFYLGSLAATAPLVYYVTRDQTYESANKELSLLVDMVKALRKYVAEDVRPPLLEQGLYHPPAVSSTVATGRVAMRFLQSQPEYYIKVASDNPLNPRNAPEPFEKKLLEKFRNNPGTEDLIEIGEIKGRQFLVSSRPSRSKASCMVCHGDPAAAPEVIRKEYGTSSGYHYPAAGEVVGAAVVGVPIGNIDQIALQRSLVVIGIITGLFTIFFLAANWMMRRSVIGPVVEITKVAREVSKGDLNTKVEMVRNDEIGDLAHSFELMRRSLVAMLKRARSQ